jgi:ABC-2 type transport system permease protein
MSVLERMEKAQQMGNVHPGLTDTIFTGYFGVFTKMKDYLYLYIPLLTMGLISRETGSGSIKLVYSSPVRVSAVVWGKFLAMVFYCMLLMACLVLLLVLAGGTIKQADLGLISSGILGLFLQVCTYAAIGLFMSSLTTYQVVAAISTLALLAALNYVGKLWQDIDFVRDITYFLSISGRVEEFIGGLISSKDVFYFLIVISLFVGLTILKLKGDRESKPFYVKGLRYTLLVVCALGLGYVTSRPLLTGYCDATATRRRTLTPASQAILAKLKGPLEITTYVNLLDENYFSGLPMSRNSDLSRYDQYFRHKSDIRIRYEYYWDSTKNDELFARNKGLSAEAVARNMAGTMQLKYAMFKRPEEMKKELDLSGEQYRLVRKLSVGGKSTFLRVYNDLMRQPGEQEFAAALKRLYAPAPKVYFLHEHNERSIQRMGDADVKLATTEITFRNSLVNQGFDALDVTLARQDIPADAAVVVIADPRTPYTPDELAKIHRYIAAGGNLFVAAEPKRREIIQPVLNLLQVQLDNGVVLQQSEDFAPSLFMGGLTQRALPLLETRLTPRLQAGMTFPGAATVSALPGCLFATTPLIATDSVRTLRRTAAVDDSLRLVQYSAALHDEKGIYPVVLGLHRKVNNKEQRIVIAGDADFMSNSELLRANIQTGNFTFLMALYKWFSYNEFPVDVYREQPADDRILVNAGKLSLLRWLLLGVLPALIALAVAVFLIRRARR